MTGIAPAIALSVATRVQARRVEIGTQAAKAYINSVRGNPDAAVNPDAAAITETVFLAPDAQRILTVDPPAASTNIAAPAATLAAASLTCVNLDNTAGCSTNSARDLVIQAFRSTTINPPSSDPAVNGADRAKGYLLGVRVYRADAFDGGSALNTRATVGRAGRPSATFAGGGGDRKSPLVEMVTEIPPTSSDTAYKDFCDRLGGCKAPSP